MPTTTLVRRSHWLGLPFVGVVAFSLWTFFTPGNDLPSDVDIWDKLGHALVFGALLTTGALAGLPLRRLAAWLFGYGVLIEVVQATLPIQRDGDWHDVLADSIGIVAGLLLVFALRRQVREPRTQ